MARHGEYGEYGERRAPRRGRRGFTIIEILIAVAITAFGFAAIFSLQIGSMQGNIAARETAAAVNLAETYAEWLRLNAFVWNGVQPPVAGDVTGPLGRWRSLTPDGPVDHNNLPDQPLSRFCVHYRLDRLPDNGFQGGLNARVRVIWSRASLDPGELDDVCPDGQAQGLVVDLARFYSISVPVALRSNGGGA